MIRRRKPNNMLAWFDRMAVVEQHRANVEAFDRLGVTR